MERRPEDLLENVDLARLGPAVGALLIVAAVVVAGATSWYTVQPEGQAVVKRFGRVVDVTGPGAHLKLPFGIDQAHFVPTRRVLKEEFGFRTVETAQRSRYEKTDEHRRESLMLTGDLNVVDVEWVVQYRIEEPEKFLHKVKNPVETIRAIAESVMRRIVGNRLGSTVLTTGRSEIATLAQEEMQEILNSYEMGVKINTIELQDVTPPDPVKPAFNAVNEARQERERLINEAEKKRNAEIPRAEGEARQLVSEAEGYAAERTNTARGAAERFEAIVKAYQEAPDVTRQRLYLEMIDKVMPNVGRLYVIEPGQTSPLPLLNLDEPGRGGSRR